MSDLQAPACPCGCGPVSWNRRKGRWNRFATSVCHWKVRESYTPTIEGHKRWRQRLVRQRFGRFVQLLRDYKRGVVDETVVMEAVSELDRLAYLRGAKAKRPQRTRAA